MPSRFGTSGSVRANSTPQSAQVRPRGPHLLAGHHPLVAVTDRARRERREVGTGGRLAEELAPHLVVAHDRRQEPQPLLLGAVREQRGRREVEAERVQPAEVERRELALVLDARPPATGRGPPYATGHVGTTSPESANTGYQAS